MQFVLVIEERQVVTTASQSWLLPGKLSHNLSRDENGLYCANTSDTAVSANIPKEQAIGKE